MSTFFLFVVREMSSRLSNDEVANVLRGIAFDMRLDGRQRAQSRPVSIEVGVVPFSIGSARVKVGGTEILVGIACEVVDTNPDSPERGSVLVCVDCTPIAAATYCHVLAGSSLPEQKARAMLVSFVQQTMGRLLGASYMQQVDLSTQVATDEAVSVETVLPWHYHGIQCNELYLGEGHCIQLCVDMTVVSAQGGNLIGCASMAVKAALATTRVPPLTVSRGMDGTVVVSTADDRQPIALTTVDVPLVVAMLVTSDGCYVVDPSLEEEISVGTSFYAGVTGDGSMCFSELISRPTKMIPGQKNLSIQMEDLLALYADSVPYAETLHNQLADAIRKEIDKEHSNK